MNVRQLAPRHLTPLPHQLEGVEFLIKNFEAGEKASYLASDPGLGKTIMAAMFANYLKGFRIYYVCPPFLIANTSKEFSRWCFKKNLCLIPDSMIAKEDFLGGLKWDIEEYSDEVKGAILIVDEAHRFKEGETKRTKALFDRVSVYFNHIVFMSGTPMPNSRPIELYPILDRFTTIFKHLSDFQFKWRYCAPKINSYGKYDFLGMSNGVEFKMKLFKRFMLRQKKDLLQLPPKIESVVLLGWEMGAQLKKLDQKIKNEIGTDLKKFDIEKLAGRENLPIATYRRMLGEVKLKASLEFIENILENTNESILIFAVHKKVIYDLQESLKGYSPLVITGDVHKDKRQGIVDLFQKGASRVFIGNIQACGVGFTLTKASRVLFVESSWVDGENCQAADRAHRIGQLGTVLVQYLCLENSFDGSVMSTLVKKRKNSI